MVGKLWIEQHGVVEITNHKLVLALYRSLASSELRSFRFLQRFKPSVTTEPRSNSVTELFVDGERVINVSHPVREQWSDQPPAAQCEITPPVMKNSP